MCLRKFLLTLGVILLLAWTLGPVMTRAQSGDAEFDLALQWMYEQGMTRYDTAGVYGADLRLTREQGAKFFAVFMEEVLEKDEVVADSACEFADADEVDITLINEVDRACELGLFKGTAGNFLPTQPLTKAQALTVLIRALESVQDESVSPWWQNYFNRARRLGLTKELDVRGVDRPITRYEMALLLYRSVHESYDPDLEDLQELEKLLLELGLKRS